MPIASGISASVGYADDLVVAGGGQVYDFHCPATMINSSVPDRQAPATGYQRMKLDSLGNLWGQIGTGKVYLHKDFLNTFTGTTVDFGTGIANVGTFVYDEVGQKLLVTAYVSSAYRIQVWNNPLAAAGSNVASNWWLESDSTRECNHLVIEGNRLYAGCTTIVNTPSRSFVPSVRIWSSIGSVTADTTAGTVLTSGLNAHLLIYSVLGLDVGGDVLAVLNSGQAPSGPLPKVAIYAGASSIAAARL